MMLPRSILRLSRRYLSASSSRLYPRRPSAALLRQVVQQPTTSLQADDEGFKAFSELHKRPVDEGLLSLLAEAVVQGGWAPEQAVKHEIAYKLERLLFTRDLQFADKDQAAVNLLRVFATWRLELGISSSKMLLRWFETRLDTMAEERFFDVLRRVGHLGSLDLQRDLACRVGLRALHLLPVASADELVYAAWAFNRNSVSLASVCPAFWPEWFEWTRPSLPRMSAKSLTLALYTVAKQQRVAPVSWWLHMQLSLTLAAPRFDANNSTLCLWSFSKLHAALGDSFCDSHLVLQIAKRWHSCLDSTTLDYFITGISAIRRLSIPVESISATYWPDMKQAAKRVVTVEDFAPAHLKQLYRLESSVTASPSIPWRVYRTALHSQVLEKMDSPALCRTLSLAARAGIQLDTGRFKLISAKVNDCVDLLTPEDVACWASAVAHMGYRVEEATWQLCEKHLYQMSHFHLANVAHALLLSMGVLDQTVPTPLLCKAVRAAVAAANSYTSNTRLILAQRFRLLLRDSDAQSVIPAEMVSRMGSESWLNSIRQALLNQQTTPTQPDNDLRRELRRLYPRARIEENVPIAEAAVVAPFLVEGLAGDEKLVVRLDGLSQFFYSSSGERLYRLRPAARLRTRLLKLAGYRVEAVSVNDWLDEPQPFIARLRKRYVPAITDG